MKLKKLFLVLLVVIFTCTFAACGNVEKTPSGGLPEVNLPQTPGQTEITETVNYRRYVRSKVNGLNVRAGAGASYAKLGSLDKGDMLSFRGEENGWFKTVYKESTAYVSCSYAEVYEMETADENTESVIAVGETLLGYPYVYGSQRYHWGNGVKNADFVAGEFDCSAYMQYIFYFGKGALLDVTSRLQFSQGVVAETPKRGDLLFFTNAVGQNKTGIERVRHVGLYLGQNYIMHTASDHAVIEEISATRWGYFIAAKEMP